MNLLRFFIFILIISSTGCKSRQNEENMTSEGELIFQSGFENDSKVIPRNSDADIIGADKSFSDHNDWVNGLDNSPSIGNFNLQYEGGDSTMRYAKIIQEPGNPANHVLHFWLDQPNVDGQKGRIQGNIYGNNKLYEFYQSERVFLHNDFNTVRKYPYKISWLTIAEFWNNIAHGKEPYWFRVTLGIGKPVTVENDLYFILDAQDIELNADESAKFTTIWSETNQTVKVPIGKWFILNYYYKEGNNQTGRFYMSIIPEGETQKVIFDLTKITQNTRDTNPNGIGDFNPFKLYTSKELINYMKSQGKTLQIYWDDFRLWKDKKPY
jgi:hypothetical protein